MRLLLIKVLLLVALISLIYCANHTKDILEITVPVNGHTQIPCNVSLYGDGKDEVLVILWYKNENATGPPLYSLDFREPRPKHFRQEEFKDRILLGSAFDPPSLLINPVLPEDDGYFSCRADYKWGRTKSQIVKLNVIVPPRGMYIKDRWNQPVYAIAGPYPQDSSTELTCIAENGKPPPRILWYLNDTLVDGSFEVLETLSSSSNSNTSVSTKSISSTIVQNQLSISKLDRSYFQSVLTCQAINTYHSSVPVSTSIRLDLYLKPVNVIITHNKEPFIAGKKSEVICKTWGSKPPARITWFLRSRELTRTRLVHSPDGNSSTSTLIFSPSADDDGSILICQAQNPNIKNHFMEDKLPLKVLYKPRLTLDIVGDQKYAIQGSIVIIDCLVDANPPANSIKWFFNDKPLGPNQIQGINLENNSLLIMNPKPEQNEGNYRCGSENSLGSSLSNYLFLSVFYSPICKDNDLKRNYEARLGDTIEVKCAVDASPKTNLSFTWSSASTSTTDNKKILTNYTSHGDSSLLHYRLKNLYDFGYIYCSAKNIVGHQNEPCIFTIKPMRDLPQPPRDCHLTNDSLTIFSVKCAAEPSKSSLTSSPDLYCLEVYDPRTGSLVLFLEESQPSFKITLTGMKEIYEYSLHIYAKNSFSRSAYTNITLKSETQLMLNQVANNSNQGDDLIDQRFSYVSYALSLLAIIIIILVIIVKTRCQFNCDKKKKRVKHDEPVDHKKDCEDVTMKEAAVKPLVTINLKEQSKSSAPDIIELSCDSLVVSHHERQEKTSIQDISEFILADEESYPVHLILSEDDDGDAKQRVFCVSTLV